jgi:hypothetical protein
MALRVVLDLRLAIGRSAGNGCSIGCQQPRDPLVQHLIGDWTSFFVDILPAALMKYVSGTP